MAEDTKQPTDEVEEKIEQTVEAPEGDGLPENNVTVEDTSEGSKKLTVEVDRKRIDAKFDEIFGELHDSALVPGFRKGHAPRRLLEKRFGKEVGEDVRNSLVSEALRGAIEQEKLEILGDPEINLEEIEVPEQGNLSFSVEVEVKPEFELPEYKAIEVAEAPAEATPERVKEATRMFLANRGVMSPVAGQAELGDLIVADVTFSGEGIEKQTREAIEMRVAPGAIDGVPLEELGDKIAGAKTGETVTIEATVPDGHPQEAWRGKKIAFELALREVKRLEVPELTDELAGEYGLDSAEEMTDRIRQSLQVRLATESRQNLRNQVIEYLLKSTSIEVPKGVTSRHTMRALQRRYLDLLQRGVDRDQIDQNLEMLQAQAADQAQRDLKVGFILEKIAEIEGVSVDDGEVNARIAQMAAQYGRRPERLRSELASEGNLDGVQSMIREEKTLDKLLELAKISKADSEKSE